MAIRLLIRPDVRLKMREFSLGRTDGLRLVAKLHEVLPERAADPTWWVMRRHAAYPDSFIYNVMFARENGRPCRVYCVCQRAGPDAIRLVLATLVKR